MLSRFQASFQRHFPDLVGSQLLVALSGGPDSVALTWLLFLSRHQLGVELGIMHVHHGVRGEEADRDAAFCQQLAAQLGLPFFLERLRQPPAGVSWEAFWRQRRYEALERVRKEMGFGAVATGHTLDDQAETVLLKLLRGSGPRGVAGIRRRREWVVRPLLDFRRRELAAFLAEQNLAFCWDSTNVVGDRPRTFLRRQILPLLEAQFPRAAEHMARLAELLEEDERLLAELAFSRAPLAEVGRGVPVAVLRQLPRPLLRRWLLATAAALPLREPPSWEQCGAVEQMVQRGTPRAVDLGQRWVLRWAGDRVVLLPPPAPPFPPQPLSVPGRVRVSSGFVVALGESLPRGRHRAFLNPAVRHLALEVAPLPAGARFRGKIVKECLRQLGVPASWRSAWPVLCAGARMIWVPGVGVAPGFQGDEAGGVLAEMEEPWERRGKW